METQRVRREQSKSAAVVSDDHRSRAAVICRRPLTLNDAHSPAHELGRSFELSGPSALFPLQAKLSVSPPGDQYEQEADRVAAQVMRMPGPAGRLQRKCGCAGSTSSGGSCEECSKGPSSVQRSVRTLTGEGVSHVNRLHSVNDVLRSTGQPLDTTTRSFMESRFNQDFGHVRIHTGPAATASTHEVQARAYTLGHDVVFGLGEYAPETMAGQRLLAHELTHVVQQGQGSVTAATIPGKSMHGDVASVRQHLPQTTIAGDWIIDNANHKASPKGKTDAELLGDAFQEICALTQRSNDHISLLSGAPATGNLEGCDCLRVIENDLTSSSPAQAGEPHIQMDVQGWSTTRVGPGFPAKVGVRHPESTFEWGYWTGGQTRHTKPFWQTVAHEVCGHVAAFVRTRGKNVGTRGVGMGHNVAIEGENLVAAEHGVVKSEQRGLDMDPTGTPLPGHRGESFLQATIFGFAHASDLPPAAAGKVISDAVDSVIAVKKGFTDLFIQVEGFALTNEGASVAKKRADNVRKKIETALKAKKISLTVSSGSGASAATVDRLRTDIATVLPGSSTASSSNPGRRVHVYLFHQIHSAGP